MTIKFNIYDFEFEIEYLNLNNSTISGLIKVYKNNYYMSLFGSIIIKENTKISEDFLNLHISFNKSVNGNKLNNDEILISRAIDKAIRPLLNDHRNLNISINIVVLQMQNWIDLKFISIFTALALLRKAFNINAQVACISNNVYLAKYDRNASIKNYDENGYIIVVGNKTHINFIEVEGKNIQNIETHIQNLLNICDEINNHFINVKSIHKLINNTNMLFYEKRIANRHNDEYRKFDIQTNWSNNTLILNRGDTQVLSHMSVSKNDMFEFDHTYKSSGFATNELTNKSSRREIGHGDLIHKSLYHSIYNISTLKNNSCKLLSYILNANGSTSMASVMASSLNLLKEGYITTSQLLYGMSFGLLFKNHKDYEIITDMIASEDNISSMDLKIISNENHQIYAIQMDVKHMISYEIILQTIQKSKQIFTNIRNDIITLIDKKRIQTNTKTIISNELSTFFKNNTNVILYFKKYLQHFYFDNKIYMHLQDTKINLQHICNFYLNKELRINDTIVFILTESINNDTTINNFHNCKFTRKQTLTEYSLIECVVKGSNKLTFVRVICNNIHIEQK